MNRIKISFFGVKEAFFACLIFALASCNGDVTYNLMSIESNVDLNHIVVEDIPDWYFDSYEVDRRINFIDNIDFETVFIEHTGEQWADKAQIYHGSSFIKIKFPNKVKVFSFDWPQPAISSDPINTSVVSEVSDDGYFESPIVIELTHKFRNPNSIASIEGLRVFESGIGIGYEENNEIIYYNFLFKCKANLKVKGKFL